MHIFVKPLVLLSQASRDRLYKLSTPGDSVFKQLVNYANNSVLFNKHPELLTSKARRIYKRRGLNKNIIGIIAKDDNKIIGWAGITLKSLRKNKYNCINYLSIGIYVAKEYRGSGISKELIKYTEVYARKHGFNLLTARPYNDRGIRFFQSCGFLLENSGNHVKYLTS